MDRPNVTDLPVGIVTDSTADLPNELANAWGIAVVPAILVVNGKDLADGADISRKDFYQQLPRMQPPPTTSAPSAGAFQQVYERLFSKGVQRILSIHVASTLSGIYNVASLAAQSFGDRVQVVDSRQVTMGLGFQVLAAAEALRRGVQAEKIPDYLDSVRKRVCVFAMLDTFEFLRRSGRVSWAKASLGTLLNLKLLIELRDGVVRRIGQARTRPKGIQELSDLLRSQGPLRQLAMLHTNAEEDARTMLSDVSGLVAEQPVIVNVTTVIGTHVGPNALGFVAVRER